MTVLLKNGFIIDGAKSTDNVNERLDILTENGVIREVGENITEAADRIIDCSGLTVIPGICDMHVHLRDPGQTHKEDLSSGSDAAAAGGVTAVMCMPNTTPVIDTPEAVCDIIKRSKACKIKIYPCASITKGLNGDRLCDFHALKKAGAVAVSDDGKPVKSAEVMMRAMLLAKDAGLSIISHCEDLEIDDTRISENIITARELCLAENLNVPVHIAHVSTKEAIGYIKSAKSLSDKITCEVTPHHFSLTDEKLLLRDADYRMNPPLRNITDVEVIREAVKDGVFDCIASDHAPHAQNEKSDFDNAMNGVLGLETILAVTLTRFYHTNILPMRKIVEMLCVNPRRILGISGGGLQEGEPADIAIVNLNEEWIVQPDRLKSKSRNTCFKGMKLKGRVKYTLVDGEIVYEDGGSVCH